MINIEKLLKSKHIKVCGNRFFGYSCIVEDKTSRLYSITICGKRFCLPRSKERGNIMRIAKIKLAEDELSHLINDTIAYIWKIEDTTKSEDLEARGYYSRKALLEKLKAIEKKYFQDRGECCK